MPTLQAAYKPRSYTDNTRTVTLLLQIAHSLKDSAARLAACGDVAALRIERHRDHQPFAHLPPRMGFLPLGRPAPLGLVAVLAGFDFSVFEKLTRSPLTVPRLTPSCVAIVSIV